MMELTDRGNHGELGRRAVSERRSERDPHFHKVRRLKVNLPSQRPFLGDWWVARNAWTTWKDLPAQLEMYFGADPESP